jgi:hypothetical protein
MTLPEQTVQTAGAAVTGVGTFTAFIASAMPVLQFSIAVVTLIVGVLTAIYTWKRIRSKKTD